MKKTFKFPRMYLQYFKLRDALRIRIIYPNGNAEFFDMDDNFKWKKCCYSWFSNSPNETLERMKKYDKDHNWSKAVFLGEIK